MKRLTLVLICMTLTLGAFAQGPHNNGGHKNYFERIKAEKVAFITDKLDLSSEEAQVFWPVYNEYWKESQKAHGATMKAFRETTPQKGETISDAELEAKLDTYIKAASAEQKVLETYHPKFKKVLPLEKVAKLYQAEEAFRMKMIRSLGNGKPIAGGHNGGKGQHQAPLQQQSMESN